MGIERIGDNILKLRKKKGITQEVLAEFMGVTKTSVSKWETGATLPDIQLLPLLASYFEISIDELMNYVPMLNKEQIRSHYHRLADAFSKAPYSKVLEECQELIKKYYACYPFLEQMTVLLLNHIDTADTKQLKHDAFHTAYSLCDHILTGCQDIIICKNAASYKAILNLFQGRADLVIDEIEKDALNVNFTDNWELLLTMAYIIAGRKKDAQKSAQIGMYRSLINLIRYGINLLEAAKDDPAYCIALLHRLDNIIEDFSMMELQPNITGGYEYQAAVYLAGTLPFSQDINQIEENVFFRLERYVHACRQLFDDNLNLHGDAFFNCLDQWFDELVLGSGAVRSKRSVKETIIQSLKNPVFTKLKDQQRLQKLTEEIQKCLKSAI